MDLLDSCLALVAPHKCVVCYNTGAVLCDDCTLPALQARCLICDQKNADWSVCGHHDSYLASISAVSAYENAAKQLILGLKANRQRENAKVMAKRMIWTADLIDPDTVVVACPSTPARIRTRGLDHGQLIAKHFAHNNNLRLMKNVFLRTDKTKQAYMGRQQRLGGGLRLQLDKKAPKGAPIILVDDVVTTGKTLNTCASLLAAAGHSKIDAVTFAYTLP